MRAVVQRTKNASVTIDGETVSSIGMGLTVLVAVEDNDTDEDIRYLSDKILNLRIFEDENEKMNYSLLDIKGELLIVSQFTLYGDCRKGRRPNFMMAAEPTFAKKMYEKFVEECKKTLPIVKTGEFQADMKVQLINDGPVTLMIDTKKNF